METTTVGAIMPLVDAAFEGDMVRVQALIEEGADVNERDASGRTALMIAANRGHTYVVQLLLERGADANARDNQGLTAIEAAESRGFQRIVSLLGKFSASQQGNGSGRQTGASASRLSLHRAVDEGDFAALQALIETGADVNARSNDEWTPLMLATIKGQTAMIEALLKNGADVNARNKKGWTALMFAVSMSDIEAMRILLLQGANINARDKEGRTVLMQAANENNRESLRFLLEVGADVSLKDLAGETALDIARRRKFDEIAKLLKRCEGESGPYMSASPDKQPTALSSAGLVNDIFNESELERLKKELAPFMNDPVPQGGALMVQPSEAAGNGAANTQALVPAHLSDVGERLIAALQAMLQARSHVTEQETVADIAQKLILTLSEASTLSNLSRTHLRQAMRDGKLRGKIIGRGWRIKRTDLDLYVRAL